MHRVLLVSVLVLGMSVVATAQGTKVPSGSKVFLAPMEGNLDGFVAAEIVKKRLPITVVTDEKDADFVLTGTSIRADDKWYHVVFGGKDKNEGNVKLINVKERSVV
jgi:hypothetical protein